MFCTLPEASICYQARFITEVLRLIISLNFANTLYYVKDLYHQHIYFRGPQQIVTLETPPLNLRRTATVTNAVRAIVLYLVNIAEGHHKTQSAIAKAAGTSEVTVRNSKEIRQNLV